MKAAAGVHSVTTRGTVDGRWLAVCTCGDQSPTSDHKPLVEQWRRSHYAEANRVQARGPA